MRGAAGIPSSHVGMCVGFLSASTCRFWTGPPRCRCWARLWRPGGPTKTLLARELISVLPAARPEREIHVVADGTYLRTALRHLPWIVPVSPVSMDLGSGGGRNT